MTTAKKRANICQFRDITCGIHFVAFREVRRYEHMFLNELANVGPLLGNNHLYIIRYKILQEYIFSCNI